MAQKSRLPRGITHYRGRYRVRLNHEGRTHALGMYETLTDARAALEIARGAMRGRLVPPAERRAVRRAETLKTETQSMTLGEWAETRLGGLESDHARSRATVLSYRSVLKNHVLEELGNVRLADLTTSWVAEHLAPLLADPRVGTPVRASSASRPTSSSSSGRS